MGKKSKESFLENPTVGVQLSAQELPAIAREYEKKYGIKIIVNGETSFGQKVLSQREAELRNLLSDLNDEKKKYATYLVVFWKKGDRNIRIDPSEYVWERELSPKFKSAISKFLTEDELFKKDIDYTELAETINSFSDFKNKADINIPLAKTAIKIRQIDEGLNRSEVAEEISQIQNSLTENQLVGYLFTNSHKVGQSHVDALIIANNKIYRPVDWRVGPDKEIYKYQLDNFKGEFIDARFNDEIADGRVVWIAENYKGEIKGGPPVAQATEIDCASESIVYLKELLKEDGKQLKEYSLAIPYYDKYEDRESYYFVPSPQVLRYSQSTIYNNLIKAMIADDSDDGKIVIERKEPLIHKRFTATSLKAILEKTKIDSKDKPNGEKIAEECDKLLKLLPEFREKWVKAYSEIEKIREQMQDSKNKNQYLTYKGVKLHQKGMFKENKKEEQNSSSDLSNTNPKI